MNGNHSTNSTSMPPVLQAFPAVVDRQAHTLILGSMPGVASLQAQQYYAHPRNAFWPIIAALAGESRPLADWPYAERLHCLQQQGLALWDVLQACNRAGSLDANIEPASRIANDFSAFFASYPQIRRVFFNGSTAEHCFRTLVMPQQQLPTYLHYQRLASTSPAHAGWSLARKLAQWHSALQQD